MAICQISPIYFVQPGVFVHIMRVHGVNRQLHLESETTMFSSLGVQLASHSSDEPEQNIAFVGKADGLHEVRPRRRGTRSLHPKKQFEEEAVD